LLFQSFNYPILIKYGPGFAASVIDVLSPVKTLIKKIRITIKPGSQIGEILRVSGKGLIRDGRIGDMLIELSLDIPTNPSEEYINKINDLKNIR
jgi:DnaJ-class molecular chaperone